MHPRLICDFSPPCVTPWLTHISSLSYFLPVVQLQSASSKVFLSFHRYMLPASNDTIFAQVKTNLEIQYIHRLCCSALVVVRWRPLEIFTLNIKWFCLWQIFYLSEQTEDISGIMRITLNVLTWLRPLKVYIGEVMWPNHWAMYGMLTSQMRLSYVPDTVINMQ